MRIWFCRCALKQIKGKKMQVKVTKKNNKTEIPVQIRTEFIKLEAALKFVNAVESGGMAKSCIRMEKFW